MEKLSNDGFWAISGALVGAFVGSLCGLLASLYLDLKRESNVKSAFYTEAEFLSSIMGTFLVAVVSEYEKSEIDLAKNDSFSGPLEIDFSVLDTLFFELYKTKNIPSPDHRQFVLNLSSQWKRICEMDVGRVETTPNTSIYQVSPVKSKEIVFFLVDLLYYFNLLVEQQNKFKLVNENKFQTKALIVFSKYKVDNSDLVEKIAKETAHW
ncbi:hypothetical protein [Vibrio alfacsensis]|uniref:hypothetical protein n=1 Tax=Vibrio alfacsensis TaxID=1074311 RepID=UPI001C803555|nr:hypothetical protein [Vibrio alfacsensis]